MLEDAERLGLEEDEHERIDGFFQCRLCIQIESSVEGTQRE